MRTGDTEREKRERERGRVREKEGERGRQIQFLRSTVDISVEHIRGGGRSGSLTLFLEVANDV